MKKVLVSGASFAGLSTAFWLRRLGYDVTVVEAAPALRTGGTAVNIEGRTLEVCARMGILDGIRARRLRLERWDFKNADDVTVGGMERPENDDELEIERNELVGLVAGLVEGDVELRFGESVTALRETPDGMRATLRSGAEHDFALVLGCDGAHSNVRRLWFGPEPEYTRFLEQYFSVSIVEKSLVPPNTAQMFNVPGKAVMLNAYKDKTDIVFCYVSEQEVPYDHRDQRQQRARIAQEFAGVGWRVPELLAEVSRTDDFYFDKLCQVRMPAWSKGRVALVGDAGYCVSPAAGKGGSIALDGAAALADALARHPDDLARAFGEYEASFRPYIEEVQGDAVRFGLEMLCPRTEEAIARRNAAPFGG